MLKSWNHSTTTINYAVTHYKTLDEVAWHLGLKELKKWQTFSTARWVGGGALGGGGQQWGVSSTSTSKNRPSQHKYKSPKQFELN